MSSIYLCRGSDCRKDKLSKSELGRVLQAKGGADPRIKVVGCQKICKAPVVGAEVDGKVEWFRGMDCKKSIEAFGALVETGKIPKALKPKRIKKRRGKLRK